MIVTLAGHVDHGKTSLVKALTGVNTDKLKEEALRGLTIDLGFAYSDNGKLGFVDVPGHKKFIHNMVAGVAANQHAMLVVAADDGIMPQTREHLEILSLIGLKSGCVVITKKDRVTEDRLKAVTDNVRELTKSSFLKNAEFFCTGRCDPFFQISHSTDPFRSLSVAFEPPFDHLLRIGIDGTEDPRKGLEGKFSLQGGFDPEATPAVIG